MPLVMAAAADRVDYRVECRFIADGILQFSASRYRRADVRHIALFIEEDDWLETILMLFILISPAPLFMPPTAHRPLLHWAKCSRSHAMSPGQNLKMRRLLPSRKLAMIIFLIGYFSI